MYHLLVLFLAPSVNADGRVSKCCGQELDYRSCQVEECEAEVCVDCQWEEWSEWSGCDCDGLQERSRGILNAHNKCGKTCTGAKVETQECIPDCFQDIQDCEFDEWLEWSCCTATCDGGEQVRMRDVKTEASETGKACTGPTKIIRSCGDEACAKPVDCVVGDWGDWSDCSVTCSSGQQNRTRRITTPSSDGGQPCDAELEQVAGCVMERCEAEVDCVWGNWAEWSACTNSCDGGNRTRGRLITTAPRNGGQLCEALDMAEVEVCNMQSCEETNDCQFGEWTEWDACSCSCNGITHRVRHIDVFPGKGGIPCEGPLREISNCNWPCGEENEKEPIDCELGEWGEWGECSSTCAAAQRTRQRSILKNPENGGKQCVDTIAEVEPCEYLECPPDEYVQQQLDDAARAEAEEQQRKNENELLNEQGNQNSLAWNRHSGPAEKKTEEIVDCGWSEWADWGACSATCDGGQKVRQRQIEVSPSAFGRSCTDQPSMEVVPCGIDPCPCEDCAWAAWSEWGACTCTGLMERHRNMMAHFHQCGAPCVGPKVETKSCEPSCAAEKIPCSFTEWSEWTNCPVTCGGAQIKRSRAIKENSKAGGSACEGFLEELLACGEGPCSDQVDCLVSEWNEWTACTASCDGGQQFRDRKIIRDCHKSGKPCADVLKQVQACNTTSCERENDCKWGPWSPWSDCTKHCGGGTKSRDRSIATSPHENGKLCEALQKSEQVACNTDACGEGCRDAEFGQWTDWTECSVSCDNGWQRRKREVITVANDCGKPVDGLMQEFKHCGEPCGEHNPIDCEFSEWSEVGPCSATCDGVTDRSRSVKTYADDGGKPCVGPMKEVLSCNVGDCNYNEVKDCTMGEWQQWDECTAECGGGMHTRSRQVEQVPTIGGRPCERDLRQIRGCNVFPCTRNVDCVWGDWVEWGSCTKECGGGQKIRYRHITTLPKHGGKECEQGDAVQMSSCNDFQCGTKVYCEFNLWTEWGQCSATCGTGQQTRVRELVLNSEPNDSVLVAGQFNEMVTLQFSQLSYGQIISVFCGGMLFSAFTMVAVLRLRRRGIRREEGHEQLLLLPED